MDFNAFSERIGNLIGEDDLKTAISDMSQLLKNSKKLDEVIVQSARYTDLMNQIRRGTIDMDNADVNKNKIRFALLDLLREVETTAAEDPEIKAEINGIEEPRTQTIIRQSHSGSGDNVGGDKVVNN